MSSLALIDAATIADQINAAHEAALTAARSAIEHAKRAGELLIAAKDTVPHGHWLPWLAQHCPALSIRSAQAYMRLAREWPRLADADTQRVAHLPLRDALA